jgi:type II secretory pathway predicted ATPase ExeA/outer membrane protein OmpA-like peptidoglycan-associated protein
MFETFYELTTNPFRLSVDENFCYNHRAYNKAWSYLKYALGQAEGFVLITGRPGTGKTTLVRNILSELQDESVWPVNLATNQFQGEELLRLVALDFGFAAQDFNKATLLTRIEQYALKLYEKSQRVVIIVDEAQNLSPHGLEELRLLSNLQCGSQSLFQIFLIGQEELRSLIYGQGLVNLQQRIVASCRLEPMSEEHVKGYAEYRLNISGWKGDPDLESAIYPLLHLVTHGVPREVNLVMARLLLYGSLEKKHTLTLQDLIEILNELAKEHRLAFNETEALTELAEASAVTVAESAVPNRSKIGLIENETVGFQLLWQDSESESASHTSGNFPDSACLFSDTGEVDDATILLDDGDSDEEAKPDADDEARPDAEQSDEPPKQDDWVPEAPIWKSKQEELPSLRSVFNEDYHSSSLQQSADDDCQEQSDKPPKQDDWIPAARIRKSEQEELPSLRSVFNEDYHCPTQQQLADDGLPALHAIYTDENDELPGLYSGADDLQQDSQQQNSDNHKGGNRKVWRWFFYPVAVTLLLIALLVPKPHDLGLLWHHLWKSAAVTASIEGERQEGQTTDQTDVVENESAISDEATPAASVQEPQQPERSEKLQIDAEEVSQSRSLPSVTETVTPSKPEVDDGVGDSSGMAPVEVDVLEVRPNETYTLVFDGNTGSLSPRSQQIIALMAASLRKHPDTLAVITGLTESGDKPWAKIRKALLRAEQVSAYMLEKGVKRQRIVIEGSLPAQRSGGASIRLKPIRGTLE